ncbi:MAG TPA: STAS domain-containing protein [Acidimicrobiales bacterium]|nr:STAS domain-containing protein [Acidimicrobiales bacterium]
MTNAHDFSTEISNGRLCLRGELDVLGSAALRRTLNGLRGQVAVLDLAEVTFIDGRGLRVLLDARDAQRDLRLENPSPRVIRLLEVMGLTDALLGCETFTDA